MLTIVQSKTDAPDKRLGVAISHLEAAIVHINNEAQRCIPVTAGAGCRQVDDLRLIVRALSDVIEVLRAAGQDDVQDGATQFAQAAPQRARVASFTDRINSNGIN